MIEKGYFFEDSTIRDTVEVKLIYVDIMGDLVAGLLLSQIVYCFLSYKSEIDGVPCIVKKRSDWWKEIRLGEWAYDRAIKLLEEKKFVKTYLKKFNGAPVIHIVLNEEEIRRKIEEFGEKKTIEPAVVETRKSFFSTNKWVYLRNKALAFYPSVCMCCGEKKEDGAILQVDHIRPRSKYPELQYDFDNLQILCHKCNAVKSNLDETDFRKIKQNVNEENCYA